MALGGPELLLVSIVVVLGTVAIILRVMRRNRQRSEKPPEDGAGW